MKARTPGPLRVLARGMLDGLKAFPATGVQFVGTNGGRQLHRLVLDGAPVPDAEELTRATAMATSAYAFTAIMYRASKLAEPPLMVVTEDEEGETWEKDHELAELLERPSPDLDMGELVEMTEIYRLVTGGCIWVIENDAAGRKARLTPFSRDQYHTETADGLIYGRFVIPRTADGRRRTYRPDQTVHFREPQLGNNWHTNISRLDIALATLDMGHQVNRTVHNFLRKAMFPGGVVSPHPDWDPQEPEWERYKAAVKAWHGGPANAGEPLVLLGGSTFSRAAIPLKELLPSEVLDRIEAVVGSVFGVPPIVLGWLVGLKNSPWSQMEEARRTVYEETVEPRWRDVERRAGRQLLSPEELSAGRLVRFDTSKVRALQADRSQLAATAALMRREWTLDERRIYTGMEPLEEGDERGDRIEGGSTEPVPPALVGAMGAGWGPELKDDPDGRGFDWLLFDVNTKATESAWASRIGRALGEQVEALAAIAESHLEATKTATKAVDPDSAGAFQLEFLAWLDKHGNRRVAAEATPLLESTGQRALRAAASQLNISWAVLQPGLAKFVEREAAFLASVMGQTTGRAVANAVQEGLLAGDTVSQLVKRLRGLPAFNRKRAFLVARTETTRAWNGAQVAAMKDYQRESGERVLKKWLSARDPRVRDAHAQFTGVDGEEVPVDVSFSNGLDKPGEPNCRCTLTYRTVTEEDG